MKILNKIGRYKYKIHDTFEAGIVLTGSEVKAVKRGSVDLTRSHAKFINNELFLVGAIISSPNIKDSSRTRKLLVHKSELVSVQTKIKQFKYTLIPLSMYTRRNLVKVQLGIAQYKRKYEHRESLKRRDLDRELRI